MRSWRLFNRETSSNEESSQVPAETQQDETPFRPFPSSPNSPNAASGGYNSNTSRDGFMGFMNSQRSSQMERIVAASAQNLGDGVQRIVLQAKAKDSTSQAWKTEILDLLQKPDSDIDKLRENSVCEKFVLRCVENSLPPNLIHCLRLLRVLELQHAAQNATQPLALEATKKVADLLCLLATDPVVGEQLRPHLFGLLALSGASYPPTGKHVAQAASRVILALAEHCLTKQLVHFIHERKMVSHMTDDVKELVGMCEPTSEVPNGLLGAAAEEEGLWQVALNTVVQLLVFSCYHNTVELVKDFEAAGGYKVLKFVLEKANNAKPFFELLPMLVSCSETMMEDEKPAVNINIFDILEDLLHRSNPLLREYQRIHGRKPDDEPLPTLAQFSLEVAAEPPGALEFQSNIGMELLEIVLQLFSDHPDNYETIESRLHLLTYSLLAIPCMSDTEQQSFCLKMLEFVVTGVGITTEVIPIHAIVEIFFAVCASCLQGSKSSPDGSTTDQDAFLQMLAQNAQLIGSTLEKLLQFDQRVAPLMVESGMLTVNLNRVLDLIANANTKSSDTFPPRAMSMDSIFIVICGVLKLLVAHQPTSISPHIDEEDKDEEVTNLHRMLRLATKTLGPDSCAAAAGAFEAYMASFASLDGLRNDIIFVLNLLEYFAQLNRKSNAVEELHSSVLKREIVLIGMLRSVLEARNLARDAFRECGGFESIIRLLLSFRGFINSNSDLTEHDGVPEALIKVFQAVFSLLDAAIGSKSRSQLSSTETTPFVLLPNTVVDPMSGKLSSHSPPSMNCNYMRRTGFYLDFAATIAGTGVLESDLVGIVFDMAMSHVDPALIPLENAANVQFIRNPDATRLIMGIAVFMQNKSTIAMSALDALLTLTDRRKEATTLSQIASCGICASLTNPKEFAPMIFSSESVLRSKFLNLLKQIAAFRLSYSDFVSMLRCIGGPILSIDDINGRVRLPIISSSVSKTFNKPTQKEISGDIAKEREDEFCDRLESLAGIIQSGDRQFRLKVGGDSINTIAVLLHQIKLDERLRAASEEGRLKFLEVESIDASAIPHSPEITPDTSTSNINNEVWTPLTSNGFTYSLWLKHDLDSQDVAGGNLYVLDLSSPTVSVGQGTSFLSIWYDLQNQRFNVMSSASYRGEPICFPVSPLTTGIWHHIMVTYTPAKRSVIARKSVFAMYVDGRRLEADVRVEGVNLPPNSHFLVGAPNPALATSGVVRGKIPFWEVGPILMLSTVLLDLDATALFAYGPDFPGLLWGDRPQHLSLAATATALFSMLADTGELGSVAGALRRRGIGKLETAGYSISGHTGNDSLSSHSLNCRIPPECVVFAFQARTIMHRLCNGTMTKSSKKVSQRLANLAQANFGHEYVSTDAIVYGNGSIIAPMSAADNLQWVGGPNVLLPLVSKASTPSCLSQSLKVLRMAVRRHRPNLESMQAEGGYRMLAVLLQEKVFADESCLDQCIAFAVHGFDSKQPESSIESVDIATRGDASFASLAPNSWVLVDSDAMKHIVLNHQIWDLKKYGSALPLRILSALNRLVDHRSLHKAFNARRLHMVGIVRWALHLMIEASDLYTAGERSKKQGESNGNGWFCEAPLVAEVSVGGDPGNIFLQECKNLLRRVLTFMLTPADLESVTQAIIYSISATSPRIRTSSHGKMSSSEKDGDDKMMPFPTMRMYLVRLLEELVVDGVNEIVSTTGNKNDTSPSGKELVSRPHAGGVASPGQLYLTTSASRGKCPDGSIHPKHIQAQAFLSAFSGFLTPAWFATLLEGCHEEATSSAVLRLMILMLQSSSSFEAAFKAQGAFSPFVISVPKFSTCPGIVLSLLTHMLNVPILHLHTLPTLNPLQLCELFDTESNDSEPIIHHDHSDPSSGVFSLIAECIGRNVQIVGKKAEDFDRAKITNDAIFKLILRRLEVSQQFREFCRTAAFLEPLSQALCMVFDENLQSSPRHKRRSYLSDVPLGLTPTERFAGGPVDSDAKGIGMVKILRLILKQSFTNLPRAALVVRAIFRSFPVHASPQQVEAFHLVLVEHCCSVIEEILDDGDALSCANAIGVCSVLLDMMLRGFLNPEAVLASIKTCTSILKALADPESDLCDAFSATDHSILALDAQHAARLLCVTALRLSRSSGPSDGGDDDLQASVLEIIDSNFDLLLFVNIRDRRPNWNFASGRLPKPSVNAKIYPLWQSTSVARCILQGSSPVLYPDLKDCENPELTTIAPLTVSLHGFLVGSREDVRSFSISIFVSLLQHKEKLMSQLLVTEVQHANGHTETIDVVNRGGFRALLVAHEAASIADSTSASSTVKRKYASFFDWYEKNQYQVQAVFTAVDDKAVELFPGLDQAMTSQQEAVEMEQHFLLSRLTSQGASDRTILGGLERAEIARQCAEKTLDSHAQWKRQGFDDLAYGAMKWKILLRRLKGGHSIWEGGPEYTLVSLDASSWLSMLDSKEEGEIVASTNQSYAVRRWKLDLSEGYERQRRRLLPNYEFHGLYNIEEENEQAQEVLDNILDRNANNESLSKTTDFVVGAAQMEATAELLKDLNLKRASRSELDYDNEDAEMDEADTVATTTSSSSVNDAASTENQGVSDQAGGPKPTLENKVEVNPEKDDKEEPVESQHDEDSSSYELITGLLQAGDRPENSYNVRRCTGLEVTKALLLWCKEAIYIIDGFEQTGSGNDGAITRVEREQSRYNITLRPKNFVQKDEKSEAELAEEEKPEADSSKIRRQTSRSRSTVSESSNGVLYQHRSQRISFSELYSVFRRRYQLQQNALEFYDVNRNATLIAFETHSAREEVLNKVMQCKLPNSVFSSNYGSLVSYTKFMNNLKAKVISQWTNGKMTNFDFLMHLNSFAGRTFNDLTQYPVFPWVIADYDSEEINLEDPTIYRNLSKPMGAIGEERAKQFRERYEALASTCFGDDDPPPFHYGTHYSSAAYVLYYLMRLEPFSRLALALQGGKFDVADRLFHDVGRSWTSASSENLQDVRELIPEFFYLPDFLVNTNGFDFGETQRGKTVHDVTLPKWARGDPQRFVRINRQALESDFVSKHLHHWADLIFGYKQQGQEAINALNTFVHVTYEGEVDIDSMTDPIQRASTIAQIQNFGQTPSRLERKPFPQRIIPTVVKDGSIDFAALPILSTLTPPLCVTGAPHIAKVRQIMTDTCKIGMDGQRDHAVGDISFLKGQLIGVGRRCTLVAPQKWYIRYGALGNGLSVHVAAITTRYREIDKIITVHDALHSAPISVVRASVNGEWLVTGCVDSTVRVWQYDSANLRLLATLCGHDGWQITSADISTEFGMIVTGCSQGRVLIWDLRSLAFIRVLHNGLNKGCVVSVSINQKNGNIATLVDKEISLFDINGTCLAQSETFETNPPTCVAATDCQEFMEDGVTLVTGHLSGEVRLWSTHFDDKTLVQRQVLMETPHTSMITVLRLTGVERQDTLLVGDESGRISVHKVVQLDTFNTDELNDVVAELVRGN